MARYQVEQILRDPSLTSEIADRLDAVRLPAMAIVIDDTDSAPARPARRRPEGRPARRRERPEERVRRAVGSPRREAIILEHGRPSLPVRYDTFEVPQSGTWKARLYPTKSKLDRALRSVGRIEVPILAGPHEGTGWMIAPGIAVTNRHVAERFGQRRGAREFAFLSSPLGERYNARLDFREEEVITRPFEVRVTEILYLAEHDDRAPDIALLRVAPYEDDDRPLPPPIPLFDGKPEPRQILAVIGYPARDPHNPADAQARIFGSRFDIKRFAPGEVMDAVEDGLFTHDASTLGGSSGSVVLDVATGAALGLHYAGDYGRANWAVSARVLRQTLDRALRGTVVETVNPEAIARPIPERVVRPRELRDREGYDPEFLGGGDKRVDLPVMTAEQVARTARMNRRGSKPGEFVLPYQHFSAVVDRDRRMARYTAVNIDGAATVRVKRSAEPWAFDPRIARGAQLGNALYAGNELDRGHLVRRLDPAWGPTASTAAMDTYFFTNCSPQVARFNQTLWVDLEDYVLDHADTKDFRATVFTGPVLDERDPPYRDARLPTAYWKVVVMVRADTNALSATAYLVSQSDLLTRVEFVYGQFKTYQITVKRAEALTQLSFGDLSRRDPIGSLEAATSRELVSFEDVVL